MTRPAGHRPLAWMLACAVAGACFVLAFGVLWVRSATVTRTITIRVAAQPVLIDPRDCRSAGACRVSAVSPDVRSATLRHFPGAVLLDDFSVIGDTGNNDRDSVRIRTATGVVASVTSRCVRNGAIVPNRTVGAVPAVGPVEVAAVVPGRRGCSVAVVLDVPAGVGVPWTEADELAHDRLLQHLPY